MVSILHLDLYPPYGSLSKMLCTPVVATSAAHTYVRMLDILGLGTNFSWSLPLWRMFLRFNKYVKNIWQLMFSQIVERISLIFNIISYYLVLLFSKYFPERS